MTLQEGGQIYISNGVRNRVRTKTATACTSDRRRNEDGLRSSRGSSASRGGRRSSYKTDCLSDTFCREDPNRLPILSGKLKLLNQIILHLHFSVSVNILLQARKALRALKGIVKLQSLIRGQLLRNFFKIPAIARPPRFLTGKEAQVIMTMISKRQLEFKKSTHRHRTSSALSSSSSPHRHYHRQQNNHHRREYDDDDVCHFEEPSYYHSAMTSFSESIDDAMHCYAVSNPSYMANTQSSKAKARSQSTPRLRPCSPSRRSLMGSINEGDYYYQRSLLPYEVLFFPSLLLIID